jgi:hypothetical protein
MVRDLGVNSRIIVSFPSYYPPKFDVVNSYCLINGVFTRCDAISPHILKIKDIPLTLPKGQSFQLQISGL